MGELSDCKMKEVWSGGTHLAGMSTKEVEWFWELKSVLVKNGHFAKRWCADSEMSYDPDVSDLYGNDYTPQEAAQVIIEESQ